MAIVHEVAAPAVRAGELLEALKRQLADQTPPYRAWLTADAIKRGVIDAPALVDLVHHFCMLYGRFPCIVDMAADSAPFLDSDFRALSTLIGRDRAMLARLVVLAGPLPRSPGSHYVEAALTAQRHAITLLGRSERSGCALGAALAFLVEWRTLRPLFEATAHRLNHVVALDPLPGDDALTGWIEHMLTHHPSADRALLFGAQQLAAQHQALWALLAARAEARQDLVPRAGPSDTGGVVLNRA